jgi:uncharacterized protein
MSPPRGSKLNSIKLLLDECDPLSSGPIRGSVARFHGLLTGVVSAPTVMPREWVPLLFGNGFGAGAWELVKHAPRAMRLLVRLYHEIALGFAPGAPPYRIPIGRRVMNTRSLRLAQDWCIGYMFGVAPAPPELEHAFIPIVVTAFGMTPKEFHPVRHPKAFVDLLDILADSVVEIHRWWHDASRSAAPRVALSAPCPCGSEKLHKDCCVFLHAL